MSKPLSFKALADALASVFDVQPDPWLAKDQQEKVRYRLGDAGLAAFAVFFMQSPSFLAHQRDMAKRKGTSNAQTLFGMEQIPTDTHPWQAKDSLLDPIAPEVLFVLFRYAFRALAKEGVLARFKTAEGRSLSLAHQG